MAKLFLTWPVGCQHHHEVTRLIAGAVQHRVESAAQAFAHGVRAAAQEGIRLVNKQQQALVFCQTSEGKCKQGQCNLIAVFRPKCGQGVDKAVNKLHGAGEPRSHPAKPRSSPPCGCAPPSQTSSAAASRRRPRGARCHRPTESHSPAWAMCVKMRTCVTVCSCPRASSASCLLDKKADTATSYDTHPLVFARRFATSVLPVPGGP